VGSLAGSIFDLFSGNPAQSEENALGSLGTQQVSTGENLISPAANYYENILSGNPTQIAQSLAPEISAGQNQVQQQANQNAQFGTRSGGTAASSNAAEGQERGNIINLVGGLQSGAAGAAGSLGTSQESQGAGNIGTEANLATQNQQREANDINGVAQGVASIATGFADGGFGGGGGDPYEALYNAQNTPTGLQTQGSDLTEGIQ
jgi:hypothetical protein